MSQVSCERIEDIISPFVDGEVTLEETETIIKHLRLCQHCTLMYEELCQIKSRLLSLPKALPQRNLLKKIINSNKQKVVRLKISPKSSFCLWKKWGVIAASFVIIFFLFVTGVGYFSPSETFQEYTRNEILQSHYFYSMRQPLNDHVSGALLTENNVFERQALVGD